MSIRKLRAGRVAGGVAGTWVGERGTIFWDESNGELRLSNGSTPGGKVLNPSVAASSTTPPPFPYEGELWYNPSTKELWAYHNGAFAGTINPATPTTLGGIKAGPGVVVANDGTLSLDSTGIPFNFGDFYAFTNPGPSDGACLSSINANQDINLVSNGTGTINVIGEFNIHKTNTTLENALTIPPIFSVSSSGKIVVLVPNAGGITGAIELVGNSTGTVLSPNQTGVVLHITGNQDMVSRNYIDGVNNYSLLVGRRYNGTGSSPVNVKNGELFFRIAGQAATGTSFETFGPCQIDWVATEDQGPNNQGGELRIRATPNGTSSSAGIVQVAAFNGTTGVTAIKFNGPLTGNVTGTILTAAQPNITSLGTVVGLNLAAGTTTVPPLTFAAGVQTTTPVTGAVSYNGTVFTATPIDQERGLLVTEQKYILNADRLLTNDLVSQSLVGAGVHLTGGVRYRYQILCTITKTGGNSISIGYGLLVNGGGVLAKHTYRVASTVGASPLTPTTVFAMRNSVTTNFAVPVDVTGPLVNGASGSTFDIQGVIEVTTSGYVTPQVTFLNNAPTGAVVLGNATIRVFPVGPTGANTVIGNWA